MAASGHVHDQTTTNMTNSTYHLHLFVAGDEPNSRRARENLDRICTEYLTGDCHIETTDVLEDFREALERGIFITPALVVKSSERPITIFGNLSHTGKVLAALGLEERTDG